MKYRALGNTGLLVSELVVGTVPFGGRGAFEKTGSVDVDQARRMFDMAFDEQTASWWLDAGARVVH